MDSDEGYNYEFDDEEEECSEDSAEEEADDDALDLGEVELVEPVVAGGERDGCEETGSGGGLGAGRDEEDYRYEVLTAEQILQHMVECIREVNEVIQNPATITRIMLSHFNWDKEKLMERYFDGNLDKLFSECHVINPSKKARTRPMSTRSSNQDMHCQICYLNYPTSYFTGLECGHKFCMQCWGDYLTTKIIEEGMGQTISCPAHNCDILVDDNTVMRLITDSKVKLKYQHLITNSFVECNRLLKWCPAPDCHHVVKVQYPDAKPVRCNCGRQFCFNCGENWHDPVKCKWLRKWIKKCDDDSETSNWIAANTKECPKCHVTIEKDGGCNHMVCRNQNCKAEFCWVCLGPWEPHGSACSLVFSRYNCNRYNEDDAKAARDAQERSRAALQRYLFYCNRYMNHMQSLRFEHKLYAQVKQKMEEMQQHNMSWIEVQFLKKAVDVLCQCRSTLMFTYVFAFYLKKNNQSIIFEVSTCAAWIGEMETIRLTWRMLQRCCRAIWSETFPRIPCKISNRKSKTSIDTARVDAEFCCSTCTRAMTRTYGSI
ncbi:E3 ubiquitin-protein ligase arih1l isoform X1 [Ictalurus punctatus]|uniref:RBR-type E3 ubiquitin transferase n=2 Tax=Ictalurus punctatus TaxID=7998 RepID=A0A979F2A7_ICTPU|nr:E3 ubiquitin-protein ligase arih1l isoform X1 [Ictalurus punctatus]